MRYKDGSEDAEYKVERERLNREIGASYGKKPPDWKKLNPIQDSVDRALNSGERLFKAEFVNKGGSFFRRGDTVFLFDESGRQINEPEAQQFERQLKSQNPGVQFKRTGNRTWERLGGGDFASTERTVYEAYPAPIPLARKLKQREPEPDITVDVIGEPPAQDETRGTYYFDKGRFLTRGKYNGKASRTPQRGR